MSKSHQQSAGLAPGMSPRREIFWCFYVSGAKDPRSNCPNPIGTNRVRDRQPPPNPPSLWVWLRARQTSGTQCLKKFSLVFTQQKLHSTVSKFLSLSDYVQRQNVYDAPACVLPDWTVPFSLVKTSEPRVNRLALGPWWLPADSYAQLPHMWLPICGQISARTWLISLFFLRDGGPQYRRLRWSNRESPLWAAITEVCHHGFYK